METKFVVLVAAKENQHPTKFTTTNLTTQTATTKATTTLCVIQYPFTESPKKSKLSTKRTITTTSWFGDP
jgi:hypothetical protein